MGLDPFSFAAPARIKLLVIPVGVIRTSRFESFVDRLRQHVVVRLGNVSPSSKPDSAAFSPLAFPEGLVIYDLVQTPPPPSETSLSTFEPYRQPLLVVGILDGAEHTGNLGKVEGPGSISSETAHEKIQKELENLRVGFPGPLLHQLLLFDYDGLSKSLPDGVIPVPSASKSRSTTINTVMCDLTSRLFPHMAYAAKSLQQMVSVRTPTIFPPTALAAEALSAVPSHMTGLSRPTSELSRPRSSSPYRDDMKWKNRMSLPVNMPSDGNLPSAGSGSRPASPAGALHTEIEGMGSREGRGTPFHTRRSSQERSRPTSQDQKAPPYESSNLAERDKIKHRGRVGLLLGSMYLMAGRWSDAIKEFVSSTNAARSNSDYVWQAKALDCILVCLVMCAWAGMGFQIPDVLRPTTDRPGSGSSKSRAANANLEYVSSQNVDPENRIASIKELSGILPHVMTNVLNLFSRAWTFTDEKIPPLSYSHSTIRFAKVLVAIRQDGGQLGSQALAKVVMNTDFRAVPVLSEFRHSFSSLELSDLILRAYPSSVTESLMTMEDQITILASIASMLSEIGYPRKKALILREMMSCMLPALLQARKSGAAEMGVHPAASLASLSATLEGNRNKPGSLSMGDGSDRELEHFLRYVCEAFAIDTKESRQARSDNDDAIKITRDLQSSARKAFRLAVNNRTGSLELKISILRACINICEALPSLAGALRYSADLLRTAGSGIAPSPESSNGSPHLNLDEQMRLANNISRTVDATQHIGVDQAEAQYWDEFLVRGIDLVEPTPAQLLTSHEASELEVAKQLETKREKNPFIYNPFLKNNTKRKESPLLVAHEDALFRVTLQNLYDIDLHVEAIELQSDDLEMEAVPQATMIGPYRTQSLLLRARPNRAGTLKIKGCFAKIRGCRKRSFAIFSEPWEYKADVKGRKFHSSLDEIAQNTATMLTTDQDVRACAKENLEMPAASTVDLTVISRQPSLHLTSISLTQSSIMLLEGEHRSFHVIVTNESSQMPADLILVSTTDSTTTDIQDALASKQLSLEDTYELQARASGGPGLTFLAPGESEGRDAKKLYLGPKSPLDLEIEAFGKPGVTHGQVQIDYGHLGGPRSEIVKNFFTRKITIPIAITVNPSVSLTGVHAIPLVAAMSPSIESSFGRRPVEASQTRSQWSNAKIDPKEEAELEPRPQSRTSDVLLVLDFHNSWSKALTLHLHQSINASMRKLLNGQDLQPAVGHNVTSTSHTISPGMSSRIPVSHPKIYLASEQRRAPIPMDPTMAKQFVVSKNGDNLAEDINARERFWFKQELLKNLTADWEEEGSRRKGSVDMRALTLTDHMVTVLRSPDVDFEMGIAVAHSASDSPTLTNDINDAQSAPSQGLRSVGPSRSHSYNVPLMTFLTLKVSLHNRTERSIRGLLRILPSVMDQSQYVALDLDKKLLINGLLQRPISLAANESHRNVELGFLVLSRGKYAFNVCVEEVEREQVAKRDKSARTGDAHAQARVGRCVWQADEPCVFIAQ